MFINDVNKKEDIRKIAVQTLRKYGIKFREKPHRRITQVSKSTRFFKVRLQYLENETITLKNGQQLVIPKQLYEICSFIFNHVETEGVFRKEGSRSRQQEIKLLLDRGCLLEDQHVIDVAVVLKYFLRELPEPLIPYSFHELFIRCSLIEKKIEAILLACLLLPVEHLNVLSFLMQFFSEVANHSHYNKMNSSNIATVVGPNVFPISEKIDAKNKLMVTKSCKIIKIMIENSHRIGEIPDYIIEQIGSSGSSEQNMLNLKTKRRSGSFTRIFHGLKKIVGNKSEDEIIINTVTPDLLLTPSFHHSGKRLSEDTSTWSKKNEDNLIKKNHALKNLNRRWSSVTQSSIKKKKRNSLIDLPSKDYKKSEKSKDLNEHLKLSEKEYEEIKNRVCKIEIELSRELENVKPESLCNNIPILHSINNIQSVYEQTLVQSKPLSPTTDHLAKRLSRELRIRTSEQKMIRSPSARKIGNMRRRSRELDKPNNKISKSSSFQFTDIKNLNNQNMNSSSSSNDDIQFREKDMSKLISEHIEQTTTFYGNHKLTNTPYKSNSYLCVNSLDKTNIIDLPPSKFKSRNIALFENKNESNNLFFSSNHLNRNSESTYNNDTYKETFSRSKDKLVKPNIPSIKRGINFKQKRKNEKTYSQIKRLSMNSKENLTTFTEDNLDMYVKKLKYRDDKCSPKNIPHIKQSLIVKSSKDICRTPSYVKNTPLKVLSASPCLNTNISF